jgi:transposase-like protein
LLSQVSASTGTSAQVRKELIRSMDGGDTSVEAVAKRLGTSSRSLQRRLTEEGTRYNDLLAEVRSEPAEPHSDLVVWRSSAPLASFGDFTLTRCPRERTMHALLRGP